ncbi:polymer-forming cytoskeletal protein [Balneolales bacterium ANBcel1]|nr:polymer-forming cytoskeletal protein [Balneolales bacterium ANBcel1]
MKQDNPGQPNVNMIGSGTVITGSLKTKSDLRISGTVEGEIFAESKCILSESGKIKGDLRTKEADIAGTVEGEIIVGNRLVLRSTARVSGDITTKMLMVEEGARIDGACRMSDQVDLTKPGIGGKEVVSGNNVSQTKAGVKDGSGN